MKKQLFAGIIALTSAPAFAVIDSLGLDSHNSVYIGAGYSNNDSSGHDINNASGYNLSVGATSLGLGIEAGYSNLGSSDNGSDYSLGYMAINMVAIENDTDFGIRLKLGASSYNASGVDSDNGIGFLYGAGVEYKLTDNLFNDENKELTLGLDYTNYHFGSDNIGQWTLTSRIYFR